MVAGILVTPNAFLVPFEHYITHLLYFDKVHVVCPSSAYYYLDLGKNSSPMEFPHEITVRDSFTNEISTFTVEDNPNEVKRIHEVFNAAYETGVLVSRCGDAINVIPWETDIIPLADPNTGILDLKMNFFGMNYSSEVPFQEISRNIGKFPISHIYDLPEKDPWKYAMDCYYSIIISLYLSIQKNICIGLSQMDLLPHYERIASQDLWFSKETSISQISRESRASALMHKVLLEELPGVVSASVDETLCFSATS